jgi:hypothetical protein
MADKTIKVKVDVETNVEPSIAQLKLLKKELKATAAGSEEFQRLQQTINDMEDAIKSAKTGASNFTEVLGQLPGPIGDIGNKVSGTVNTLKQFGGLKLTDLKASFVELGKDLGDAVKGLGKLTGITKVYTMTARSLSTGLQNMGVAANTATVAARGLSLALTATGILLAVAAFAQLANAIEYYSTRAERAEEAQKKLNETIQKGNKAALDAESASVKRSGDLLVAQAKARGANADEIFKIEQQNRKLLVASQERYYNDIKNKDSDEAMAALTTLKDTKNSILVADADFKAQELEKSKQHAATIAQQNKSAADKTVEDLKRQKDKEKEELSKGLEDAYLQTLTAKEKEEFEVNKKYSNLLYLATKNGEDTSIIKIAQKKDLQAIDDKYTKEDLDKQKDLDDKAKTKRKEDFEKDKANLDLQRAQKLIDEDLYQSQLKDLKIKYAEGEVESINAQVDYLNYLDEKKQNQLEKDKERANEQKEINKQITQSWIDLGSNIAGTFRELGQLFEEGSDMAKTFGIISVLVNAAAAIGKINLDFSEAISSKRKAISIATDAIAEGTAMFPLNPVVGGALIGAGTASLTSSSAGLAILQANRGLQIASVAITSGAQIAAILSAKKSATVASGGTGSGGSTTPAPAYGGAAVGMAAPQIQATNATNPSTQIAQTLGTAQAPIKAYIVSGEVSSQQALDRRTSRAATFA